MQNINSLLFCDVVKHQQNLNIFLRVLGKATTLEYMNDLRIILGSNSENLKRLKLGKKSDIVIKRVYTRKLAKLVCGI